MDRFNIVTNTLRTVLVSLANLFCGCSHARTAFPITLQAGTYVACLDCGRHLPYDWTRMRFTRRLTAWPAPALVSAIAPTHKGSQ